MLLIIAVCVLAFCSSCNESDGNVQESLPSASPFVVVLGIAQDAGFPQAACKKSCCADAWHTREQRKMVSCLAIVDPQSKERWIIDATPDFKDQLRMLDSIAPSGQNPGLNGILLTHAHIGHYTGLMHLGREVIGAQGVPVYAMPRMRTFLENNGPWDQLLKLRNIEINQLGADSTIRLNERISIRPFSVPHRDEYSETVGFQILGPEASVVFIPDIDKWERWERSIEELIAECDRAYLDGTFYADGEIPGRDMAEIPHPFIEESMRRFAALPVSERRKIRFIHLNHSNPALQTASTAQQAIRDQGFGLAEQGERTRL